MAAGTDPAAEAGGANRLAPPQRRGPPAAPAPPPLALRIRDFVASWLPLLAMGLLALGTWWLVEQSPPADPSGPARGARHIADYTMNDFSVRRFAADGRLRVQIEGRELRHYPDTDTIEVDAPMIRALAPDGAVTVATARQAISNGDGSEVQLLGAAHVVRETPGETAPPIEFRGDFLHAFFRTEQLRSHLPVRISQGATQLRADSLDYRHDAQRLVLNGRVRATFAPPGRAAGR